MGITWQSPCYSYTVGLYGKGPTGDYTTYTHQGHDDAATHAAVQCNGPH